MRGNDLDLDQQYPSRKRPSEATGFSSGEPGTNAPAKNRSSEIAYKTFPFALTALGGQLILGKNPNRKFLLIKNTTNFSPSNREVAISFGSNIFGNQFVELIEYAQNIGGYILAGGQEVKIENHSATNEVYAALIATTCGALPSNCTISITEGTQYGAE